ncbi:MAG: flagellar motor switch protein FliM [Bacillota bacterium]|jgi:flagellar motor switch protein FliM
MSDVLSQSEIDAILDSFSAGSVDLHIEENKNKVKVYDFKSPKKFSKEQTKVLMGIYENFARYLSSYFSGILRAFCEINIASVEELPYYEYNNALPDSILIGVFDHPPLEGEVLVDLSNSISFSLLERLLGGSGEGTPPNREFTEIEISLLERIFNQIAIASTDAWPSQMNVKCTLKEIESNARLVQAMAMDEIVVIIVMDVSIENAKGTITFCLPCIKLEAIIEQLIQNKYTAKRSSDSKYEEEMKDTMITHVKSAPLEANAIFGETTLTLNDILNLQIGDVIKFDQTVGSEIKINICDKAWFYGIPGIRKNKKVVKISKIV